MYRLRVEFPAVGTVYTLTAEAGAYAMTGQAATLTYNGAPVVTPSAATYRSGGANLFQASLESRTYSGHTYHHELTDGYVNNSGLLTAAPTWYAVDELCDWTWTNPGGDWLDASGTAQGTNHWVTFPMNSGSFTVYPAINVTAMVQWIYATNRWNAWRIMETGGTERTIGGLNNTDPAKRPSLTVTYTDTTTETLACRITAGISSGSTSPSTFAQTYALPCFIEFERPSKPVASATLSLYGDFQWSGTSPIAINPLNPPVSAADQPAGIANAYALDSGLSAAPGVMYAHNLADGTAEADVISPLLFNMYDSEFDPKLWNDALTADTSKLPHVAAGKWVNAKYPLPTDPSMSLVDSSYTGEGFVPLVPGLGALHVKIRKKPGFVDGATTDSSGETGAIARMFLPFDDLGTKDHLRGRFYLRAHLERPIVWADRIIAPNTDGAWQATNFTGKFGPGYCHDTTDFGFSGSSGGGGGWEWRKQWAMHSHGVDGPGEGKLSLGTHVKSDFIQNSPISYQNFRENWGDNGVGGAFSPDEWYLIEDEFIENTLTGSGAGFVADGEYRVWAGRVGETPKLVFERTGLAIRSNPVFRGSIGVPVATPGGGNVGSVTFTHNMGSPYAPNAAIPETITLTFDGAGGYTAEGSFYGTYAAGTVGAAYISARQHKWTITGTPSAGDTLTVVFPPGSGSLRTAIRTLGVRDIMINMFHGGKTETPVDIDWFIAAFCYGDGAVMTGPFGPMSGLGPPLQVTGSAWTPNRDADGVVMVTDYPKMTANTWLTVAGTDNKLRDVAESPTLPNQGAGDSFRDIVVAWSGAGFDPNRESMLINGGGHAGASARETAVFDVSAKTMKVARIINRAGAGTALKQVAPPAAGQTGWTTLIAGEPWLGGINLPLSTGVPGSNHSSGMIEWLPPETMAAIGMPAPTRGGLFLGGITQAVLNLDTGVYSQTHYAIAGYPAGNVTFSSESSLTHFMRDPTTHKMLGVRGGSGQWIQFDLTQSEMTLWQQCAQCLNPSTPSRGKYLTPKSNSGVTVLPTWALICKLYGRREMVIFQSISPDYTAKRVRYGQGVDAAAADLGAYTDSITITSDNGTDHLDFKAANFKGYYGHNLSHAGVFYDHTDGCIWVCANDPWEGTYNTTGEVFTPGSTQPLGVYCITGSTGSLDSNTWKVKKLGGTQPLTISANGTWSRFAVVHRGAERIGLRISSVDDPIEVIRLVP